MEEKDIFERLFEETFGEQNKESIKRLGLKVLHRLPRFFLLCSLFLIMIFILHESFHWFNDFVEGFATEFEKRYNYFEDYHYMVGANSDEKISEYAFIAYGLSFLTLPLFRMKKRNVWSVFFFVLYFLLFFANILVLLYVTFSNIQIFYL